nr:precorrin-3B C(17)-methyltransferase [uncultured Sellimonas sp.]
MKHEIYITGIGPGEENMMTGQAIQALEESDVIVGYPLYLKLLGDRFQGKECLSTPMRKEVDRCRMAYEKALEGKKVCLICSGDAGVYGLASLMYELSGEYPDCKLTVIPGVTAANSGAAVLGAPLNHDFCVISLSDLLTPWEQIEKRLTAAVEGDFAIAIYNPASRKRSDYLQKACDILLKKASPERACGYVENIGREGTKVGVCSLQELRDLKANMFTTIFIGNSQSLILDGKLITKRGYRL